MLEAVISKCGEVLENAALMNYEFEDKKETKKRGKRKKGGKISIKKIEKRRDGLWRKHSRGRVFLS